MTYSLRILLSLILALSVLSCKDIPIVDNRPAPEPPALPAPAMECPPVVHVKAVKMNVLYVGVDNPISLDVDNVSLQSLKILVSGGKSVFQGEGGQYMVKPYEPGEVRVLVLNEVGLQVAKAVFRAKPLPAPRARLGNALEGDIPLGTFKTIRKLNASIDNFDFEAPCMVTGFKMTRIKPNGEVVRVENEGSVYNSLAAAAILQCEVDDQIIYSNVRARCQGDAEPRLVNSLVFTLR